MEAKVINCDCKSPTQDTLYGRGKRLGNPYGKTQDSGYRCTVCGKEYSKTGTVKKGK